MTTLSYRKRYPTGATRATACRHLLAVLRRTPTRRARWYHQARRRRPWLLRPLTPGEKSLRQLRTLATELTSLLAPFRLTRPRGHEDLRGLLQDLDTRPALVAQVGELQACLDRLLPILTQHGQQVSAWRQEWDHASQNRRDEITHVCKAVAINAWVKGLCMLSEEAKQDIGYVKLLLPEAFTPTPAPEPWLDKAAGPAPYSA